MPAPASDARPDRPVRAWPLALGISVLLLLAGPALSQPTSRSPSDLPAIMVRPEMPRRARPAQRPAAEQASPRLRSRSARPRDARPAATPAADAAAPAASRRPGPETATSHVDGFVAARASTATKTDTPILETPRSISVVTSDEIEARADQTVSEALRYTAGVSNTFQERSSLGREYPYIRGFLVYQYLDGLKLHDSNWGVEPYGLERIEVLKGPSSILFGQSSPGGLINLVSKRPTDAPYREVVLQTGSYGRLQGGFDVGGPVGNTNELTYRLTGLGRYAGGEIAFTRDERAYIAPAFTWKPDGATTFTILASYQYDPGLFLAQALPALGTITPSTLGRVSRDTFLGDPNYDKSSKTTTRIGYEFEHAFDDVLTLRHNARYTYYDIHAQGIQSLSALADVRTLRRQAFLADYSINLFQSDSQIQARFETGPVRHTMLFGLDYAYIPNYQGVGVPAASNLDLYSPAYGNPLSSEPRLTQKRDQDQIQTGIYVQDQMKLGNLSIVAGVRQDRLSLINQTRARNAATGQFFGLKTHQKNDALSPSVAAIYNFENGLAPYVSYSESFFPLTGTDYAGNVFRPVTGQQLEGGLKYRPPGTRILLTGAVFDITQQNVRTTDPFHPGFAAQIGEVRSRGYELEARATFARDVDLVLAYTNLDLEVTKSTTTNLGKVPFGVPSEQFSAWADFRLPTTMLAGLSIGGGIRYVGSTAGDAANTFKVPPSTLYDAALRYDLAKAYPGFKGWDLAVNARNIADKRYVSYCDSSTSCLYGIGRSVLATLRLRW